MSLGKTFAIIFIIVVLAVAGLLVYRDQGAKSPLQSQLAAAGSALATTTAAPSSGDAAQGVIALANDPRRVAPPVTAPGVAKLDPATAKRYADALEQVEVDGCNANGTFAVRLQGEKRPRMVRSGQEVALPGGLTVTMRSRGYPNCRVMLYDGKVALGEIAGF
jgi:hypothetical protein